MIRTICISLAVLLAAALPATAGTIGISQTDFGDFVSNDISVTTSGTWTQMQLITFGLQDGEIYQNALGGDTPPNSAWLAVAPELEFDSFVANGTTTDAAGNGVTIIGGAVNLGGGNQKQFSNGKIDITWGGLGDSPTDVADWLAARITLADTANGHFEILASMTESKALQMFDGTIEGGV
ncbi:MAG TPA: hypothetical protein VE890_09710, partial [Thermoguttaceae bacterium]|nr:hypothetical protein [Thermoguttaceae bacterium]